MKNDFLQIAKDLDKAAIEVKSIPQMAEKYNLSVKDAYQIQDLLIQQRLDRKERITGYKLGFTSKAKMKQMRVDDLIWGVLTDTMEINPNQTVNLNQYIHPRAEPEIAFKIAKDINFAIQLKDIEEYIDAMAVAIEVIDSRYKDFKFSLPDVIADNCSSIGYCIGKWLKLPNNLNNLPISLHYNDLEVQNGYSEAILDNPYQSVVELARLSTQKGIVLKKGQVILAGAATAAEWLKPNTKITASLSNLGKISFEVN